MGRATDYSGLSSVEANIGRLPKRISYLRDERRTGRKRRSVFLIILAALIVYGSVTPDLESILPARTGKIVLQHGVIPGSSQTKVQGISSPGTYEAILMWPRNDGEMRWSTMSD